MEKPQLAKFKLMTNHLTDLKTLEDLDQLLAQSAAQPVVIYKHSLTCGTSAAAMEEIRDVADGPSIAAPIGLVLVQPARAVSNEIARRLGVRHESPQVLIVQHGRVQWHTSHFGVTAQAIVAALARLGAGAPV